MKFETIHNLNIPKIGFGTWSIGGRESPDPASDESSLAVLRSALELGYTHFDTAEFYAAGHTEELLGQAVRESGMSRENLFITSKVSPEHLNYEEVLTCCENSLRRLRMEYLDLYLIHWPMRGMNLVDSFRALNQLVRDSKVRYLGVSNFDLGLLKTAAELSETPLLTDQVPYSLAERTYQQNGVLEYCQQNDILLTAYSPIKRRKISGSPILKVMARIKHASVQQVALAWLVQQPRVITIPKSSHPGHQEDNLDAAGIELSSADMTLLENE